MYYKKDKIKKNKKTPTKTPQIKPSIELHRDIDVLFSSLSLSYVKYILVFPNLIK